MSAENTTPTAAARGTTAATAAGAGAAATGDARADSRDRSWTVLELLTWTTDYFKRAGIETARLDAEVLLAHALESERLRLYIDYEKPVLPAEREVFRELVGRRASRRIPVSQLLGEREFWSLPFKVTGDVLTPRPETETLVEWALSKARAARGPDEPLRILDLGTGTGAIALSLAHELAKELPHARLTATDLSPAALQIAAENADALHMGEAVRLLAGDLFEPVAEELFEVIVSNPPYIARRDASSFPSELPPELSHEPELALFAGPDGLDVIRRLVAEAGDHLSPGGWLGIELSPEQVEDVESALAAAGFEGIERRLDLAGRPRVLGARRPEN